MAQQWTGVLAAFGTGALTGTTQTVTIPVGISAVVGGTSKIPTPFEYCNTPFWSYGVFGVSMLSYSAGQNWGFGVWGNFAGVSFKIAEFGAITGVSSQILPLVNEMLTPVALAANGSTQAMCLGIMTPKSIIATGSSAGIGITASFVVTASLVRI